MTDPIPTPYDILPIPEFRWIPTTQAWLILAAFICVLLLLLQIPRFASWWERKRSHRRTRELRALLAAPSPRDGAMLIVLYRRLRLLLEPILGTRISHLSALELRTAAAATSGAHAELLSKLSRLGDCVYEEAPSLSDVPALMKSILDSVDQLLARKP